MGQGSSEINVHFESNFTTFVKNSENFKFQIKESIFKIIERKSVKKFILCAISHKFLKTCYLLDFGR